jgi:hypothetical protein
MERAHKVLSLVLPGESTMAVAGQQDPVLFSIVKLVGGALSSCLTASVRMFICKAVSSRCLIYK